MAVNIEFENISSLDCKDRKSGREQKKKKRNNSIGNACYASYKWTFHLKDTSSGKQDRKSQNQKISLWPVDYCSQPLQLRNLLGRANSRPVDWKMPAKLRSSQEIELPAACWRKDHTMSLEGRRYHQVDGTCRKSTKQGRLKWSTKRKR